MVTEVATLLGLRMKRQKPKRKKVRGRASHHLVTRDVNHRVHLVLQRDPTSGKAMLALSAPLFNEAWQNDLAVSAANTARATLQGGVSEDNVVALAQQAMDATSKLADALLSRAAPGTVACSAGCDHCCHQSVGVTPAEALAIVAHLRRTLSSEALAEVSQDFARARERTRGLSASERYSPLHPCPFLKSARCSIYDVRPLSCRGMNSLDAEECKSNLRDPKARKAFLANGAGSKAFMEPIRAFHAVSAGIQLGLSDLFGLDMRPLDLTAAVHELLSGHASITPQWLAGESPLEVARGGDNSDTTSAHELSGMMATQPKRPG